MYEVFEQLLQQNNVTPYKVARETGVTQTALSNWKSGKSTPTTKTLQKIASYFGVTIDYLMNGEYDIQKDPQLKPRDKRDIKEILSNTEQLLKQDGLMFDGQPASPEAIDSILSAMQIGMEIAKKGIKRNTLPKSTKRINVMNDIRKLANSLARKYHSRNPFEIIRGMSVILVFAPLIDVRGFYQYFQRNNIIYIDDHLPEHEQKFVCAHELGHLLMHRKSNTVFMDTRTYLKTTPYEVDADKFAIELLVPNEIILENWKDTISHISKLTGYSEELIKLRLL